MSGEAQSALVQLFREFLPLLAVRLGLWHKLPSFVGYKFSEHYVYIHLQLYHVTIFNYDDCKIFL